MNGTNPLRGWTDGQLAYRMANRKTAAPTAATRQPCCACKAGGREQPNWSRGGRACDQCVTEEQERRAQEGEKP
jgi:hypothetical protein